MQVAHRPHMSPVVSLFRFFDYVSKPVLTKPFDM